MLKHNVITPIIQRLPIFPQSIELLFPDVDKRGSKVFFSFSPAPSSDASPSVKDKRSNTTMLGSIPVI